MYNKWIKIPHSNFFRLVDTSRTLQSVQRVLFSANDDQEGDDIEIIYVNEVTPEEKEEARRLLLPDNFYLYKKLPPCSGCRGCRDDDEQAKVIIVFYKIIFKLI